jgi:16S rRNA processing protein RimM
MLAACNSWSIGGKEYPVEEVKPHSGTLLAKLAGLESREAALELKGSTVYVRREALPAPAAGHYYLADLVGLEVVNERGEALGVVKRWTFNGAQDVMEVSDNGKVRLLPWVSEVVRSVDLAKRQIHVEWEADW